MLLLALLKIYCWLEQMGFLEIFVLLNNAYVNFDLCGRDVLYLRKYSEV